MAEWMHGLIRALCSASASRLAARGIALAGASAFFCYALMVSCFDAGYSRLLVAFSCAVLVGSYALRHWGAALPLALGARFSLMGIALMALGFLLRFAGVVELLGAVHIAIGAVAGLSALSALTDSGDSKALPRGGGMGSSVALYLSLCGPALVFAAAQRTCSLLMFRVGSGPFDSMFEIGERGMLLLASLVMGLGVAIGSTRVSRQRSGGIVGTGLAMLWALVGISSALGIEMAFVVLAGVACLLMPMVLAWLVRAGEVVDIDALRFLALVSAALIVCWSGRFDSVVLAGQGSSTTMLMGLLAGACSCGVGLYWLRVRRGPLDDAALGQGGGTHHREARELIFASLSARESAVAEMLIEGATQASISEALGLSRGTVATYCHRIYEKAGCENRAAFLRACEARECGRATSRFDTDAELGGGMRVEGLAHVGAFDAGGRIPSLLLVACDAAAVMLAVVPGLAPHGTAAGTPPFAWMASVLLALLGFIMVSDQQDSGETAEVPHGYGRSVRWLMGPWGAVLVAILGTMAFRRGVSHVPAQEMGLVVTGLYALVCSMRLAGHLAGVAQSDPSPCVRCAAGATSPLLALLLSEVLVWAPARWASLLVFCGYLPIAVAAHTFQRENPRVLTTRSGGTIGFSLSPYPAALLAFGGFGLSYAMVPGGPSPIASLSWLLAPLALSVLDVLAFRSAADASICIRAFGAGAGWVSLGVLAGALWGGALPPVVRVVALVVLACGCVLYVRELGRRLEFANLDLPGKIRESCGEFGITAAEASTAALLASGLTVDECARQRFVSRATIVSQRRSVYAKLGVRTRDELRACIDKRIARRLDA